MHRARRRRSLRGCSDTTRTDLHYHMTDRESRLYTKIFKILKGCETELLAYRVVYEAVQASGDFPNLARALRAAKDAVKSEMDAKYDQAIEALASLQSEQEILQVFKKFDPNIKLN
jgi:hypothetical protein